MLRLYLVTYDIRHPKRLRLVHRTMKGFGERIQYSVFRCELSPKGKVRMMASVSRHVKHDEDSVLIFDLGPLDGVRADMVDAIGRPYVPGDHDAVVV